MDFMPLIKPLVCLVVLTDLACFFVHFLNRTSVHSSKRKTIHKSWLWVSRNFCTPLFCIFTPFLTESFAHFSGSGVFTQGGFALGQTNNVVAQANTRSSSSVTC